MKHVPRRRQVDVTPGLVRFGLERKAKVVPLVLDVAGQKIDRVTEALECFARVTASIGLRALAPAPEHVRARAEFHAEVDGVHRLPNGECAHLRVVCGERAVFEHRMSEQIRGRHRADDARVVHRALEVLDDRVARRCRTTEGYEVLVVEVHTVGANLAELGRGAARIERLAHWSAKWVPSGVAHGPESESE